MARQVTTHITSDLSGDVIAEDSVWVMQLTPPDGRRNTVQLDITETEAQEFARKGREVKRRGRPRAANGRRKKS
jgi:hypothetical protein